MIQGWSLTHFYVPGSGFTDDAEAFILTNDDYQKAPREFYKSFS